MFTRTVEVTAKSGKARELAKSINDKVLPILKKQAGLWMRPFWSRMRSLIACWH
jgi:hypothetical protein